MPKKYDYAKIAEYIQANSNKTPTRISNELGIHLNTVNKVIEMYNLSVTRSTVLEKAKATQSISDVRLKLLLDMFPRSSREEILQNFNDLTWHQISRLAHTHGVYRDKEFGVDSKKSYVVNKTFFDNWSNDMAWILGWMVTDGHVVVREDGKSSYIYGVGVEVGDKEVLYKIQKRLLISGDFIKEDKYGMARIYPSDKTVNYRLRNMGFVKDKTSEILIDYVPANFLSHYFRGLIEGDGSVSVITESNRLIVSFCGNYRTVQYFRGVITKLFGFPSDLQEKYGVSMTLYSTHVVGINAKTLLDWVYKDTTEDNRLNRKYTIYKNYCERNGLKHV